MSTLHLVVAVSALITFGLAGGLDSLEIEITAEEQEVAAATTTVGPEVADLGSALGLFFFVPLVWVCCFGSQAVAWCCRRGKPHGLENFHADESGRNFMVGEAIELKQRFRAIELCGIEARNIYTSHDNSLFIQEHSECFHRICCSVNRELSLFAHGGPSEASPVVMLMYKPFHLQGCCCFCRPRMEVYNPHSGSLEQIGEIEDPYACCMMDQQIYGGGAMDRTARYTVSGSVCQCGACCPCASDVRFDINSGGRTVGEIVKPPLTLGELFMHTNRFQVHFPQGCSPDDKKLLIASAMLLDLQYFESSKKK